MIHIVIGFLVLVSTVLVISGNLNPTTALCAIAGGHIGWGLAQLF